MRNLFFNVPVDIFTKNEAIKACDNALSGGTNRLLYFINAHCFNIAQKNKLYLNTLFSADMVLNDGIGMKIGSRLANVQFRDNLNGTDLIPQIIESAVQLKKSIYLIGGKPGISVLAKKKLELKYPGIIICGTSHGYFPQNDSAVVYDINRSGADLLIVGMGVPLQEIWLNKIKNDLTTVKLCVAGGAIIDFISGNVRRAPLWVRKANMEWLYRLLQEPGRLWRRYLIGNFRFFINILKLYLFDKQKTVKNIHLNFSKLNLKQNLNGEK